MAMATRDASGTPRYATVNPWRRLWQVPLLFLGLGVFGLGLRTLVRTLRPVPFEEQVQALASMVAAEHYSKAIDEINRLAPHYTQPAEQARLEALAGDALFLSQSQAGGGVRADYEHAVEHYRKAVVLGLHASVEMNERWGEAAIVLGQPQVAVEKLEAAITGSGGDANLIRKHARELVAACLESGQGGKAMTAVDQLLAAEAGGEDGDLGVMENRAWGLCERIEIALNGGSKERAVLGKVVEEARLAAPGFKERDPGGRVLVWVGRVELEQGDVEAARRDLTEARARFAVHHLDDGRAAVLLARIAEMQGDLPQAAARLGRAHVAVLRGNYGDSQVVGDYRFVVAAVQEDTVAVGKRPEMISKAAVRQSLLDAFQRSSKAEKYPEALTFLAMAQQMEGKTTVEDLLQRAVTKEKLGQQLMAGAQTQEGARKTAQLAAGQAMLGEAAQDYLSHSKSTTLNDELSGTSLWKAGGLLDQAGQTLAAAAVYERFTIQRPRDSRVPEGLLALGRLYESAGMTDKAIAAYQRNLAENPKTPAGYTSVVNLARCFGLLASQAGKAEEKAANLDRAEQLLLGLVQSADLQPAAREFRESLLALGDLYYANGRWSEAILRLDEVITRYPADPAAPRTLFLLGESYRKSAAEIAEALKDPAFPRRVELERARGERLAAAAGNFARVIALLDVQAGGAAAAGRKLTPLEEQYVRSSYMDRAECQYLRGDYEQAIRLYDEVSSRFSEEAIAVQAYVQIVNAYLALKQPAQAAAAAERGRLILQRIPEAAFGAAVPGQSRQQFESLLALNRH